jgi:hypothetical protein
MAEEFADNINDVATVFNPAASFWQKTGAVLSLASELLPVSVSDAKDVGRVVGLVEKVEDKAKAAAKGAAGGKRAGKAHTQAAKRNSREANREVNDGKLVCPDCKKPMNDPVQSKKGVPVDKDAAVGAHIHAKSQGGDGATVEDMRNIETKCWDCNAKEGARVP